MVAQSRTRIRSHPVALIAFVLLAFGITWAFWLPSAVTRAEEPIVPWEPGLYGPSVAAILVLLVSGGWRGPVQLLRGLLIWRVSWFWYAVVLLLPVAFAGVAWLGDWLITGEAAAFEDAAIHKELGEDLTGLALVALVPVVFLFTLIGAPLGEELGWRGYALPRLQAWWGPTVAGIVLGIVWGAWHLPLFWMDFMAHADYPIASFMVNIILGSVLFAWVFNATGGSILLAVLFHTAQNVTSAFAPVSHHVSLVAAGAAFLLVLALLVTRRFQRPDAEKQLKRHEQEQL